MSEKTLSEETPMTPTDNSPQNSSPDLFGALMDNFPDMIHSVDEQGNLVFFNNKALELLGYPESQMKGMNIRQLYAPEILEAVEKGFREIKLAEEKRVESQFIARDGTRIPVEIRTLVIRDSKGSFVQTFSISRDLRKLKEQQDNMLQAGRLAAIGELASGVVHDISNPLASVSLATSVLEQLLVNRVTLPDAVRDQATELLAMIRNASETMDRVAARLRDFSRGDAGHRAPVDLFDTIHDALFILGQRLSIGNIHVSCPLVKARHWIFGDRNQIEQVFLNLFANACDAMTKSNARDLSLDITQEIKEERAFWCCTIRDTGEGVKPEDLERIFKSFYTTKPERKAAGLGLCIARSILTEHGGSIAVESEYGQGATFMVWLPVYAHRMPLGQQAAAPQV
jgi:PAS domain S-box-containing protein